MAPLWRRISGLSHPPAPSRRALLMALGALLLAASVWTAAAWGEGGRATLQQALDGGPTAQTSAPAAVLAPAPSTAPTPAPQAEGAAALPLWAWPLIFFVSTTAIGLLAVMGGIGGSLLYVPLISGFFPFIHLDFVRGAGLMVALTGALAAGPRLLADGLAHLRLAIPVALVTSTFSIVGAVIGLALPAQTVQLMLGLLILGLSAFMAFTKPAVGAHTGPGDRLAERLAIRGPIPGGQGEWTGQHTTKGLLLFVAVGLMAGLFGIGAGWANVPVLNLVMGAPLKVAVATSYFLLAITDTTAAWVYLNHGALLPLLVVPSVLGVMLGANMGARLLKHAKPGLLRYMVIGLLLLAGGRALMRGLGL